MDAEEIHRFWFADALTSATAAMRRMPFWFAPDPATDRRVRERFAPAVEAAAAGRLAHWEAAPRTCLALVIVLDQFPRNIHRATPDAFRCDTQALEVARRGIGRGHLEALHMMEQSFLLMPFQHSEERAAQSEGLEHFERLAAAAPPAWGEVAHEIVHYARLHHEIIARFGRFPHRNAILGRESTADEAQYLAASGHTFGQGG